MSNGLLMMMGQVWGIAFVAGMDARKSPATGAMTQSLLLLIGLMVLGPVPCTGLRESALIRGDVSS